MLRLLSHYLNVTDALLIPVIFIFLYCCKKAHDNKEFSQKKIENLVVNFESWPVKSNPGHKFCKTLHCVFALHFKTSIQDFCDRKMLKILSARDLCQKFFLGY